MNQPLFSQFLHFFQTHKQQIALNIINWAIIASIGYAVGYFNSFTHTYALQAPKRMVTP